MEHDAIKKRQSALAGLLSDPNEGVRVAAAQSLERLEGIAGVDRILEQLKRGGMEAKVRAIYALGAIGGERVLAPLMYCACRPEEDIKAAAIEALGKLAQKSTVTVLIEKLKEESPALQARAIAALANFRDPALVPHILPFLREEDGLLDAEAVHALGKIGGGELEERLLEKLDSPHSTTREAVAVALGELQLLEAKR